MSLLNTVRVVERKYNKSVTYALHYVNPQGRRRRLSVGKDNHQAQRLAMKFNEWLLMGLDPEAELHELKNSNLSERLTLRDFYKIFIDRHGSFQSKSMQELYINLFKNISRCPQIVDMPISKISKKVVIDYMHVRVRKERASNATANREASMVRGMLSRALEWDIIKHNNLQGLRMLPESEKRQVNLTPEQIGALLNALQEPMASIVELAVYTGFRRDNILSMRIESIRLHDLTDTGEVELIVKGGKKEVFPLGPTAIEVIKRNMENRNGGFLFLNPKTGKRYISIHNTFDRAVRKLDLTVNGTKLRFHDIRHIHATWLHKAGVSLDVIRPLLGHRDRETTDRYVTYDRLSYGSVLKLIPKIERGIKKETSDRKNLKSLNYENGTNWHGNDLGRLPNVPRKAVNS
jgi:integrase